MQASTSRPIKVPTWTGSSAHWELSYICKANKCIGEAGRERPDSVGDAWAGFVNGHAEAMITASGLREWRSNSIQAHGSGCQSSIRFPSGSQIQAK